ncbi:hypothetical protein [Meiothermus ruber]|uniref:hypothetical protein n=1 Tax=Meiothermus ruber TaxID=277 RepID=UPI001FCC1D31|nr:hypothetical protein [Meiothermus ruber]
MLQRQRPSPHHQIPSSSNQPQKAARLPVTQISKPETARAAPPQRLPPSNQTKPASITAV